MNILFLSQRVPYPPNRGDKIITWRVVDHLRRTNTVTVICFEHGREEAEYAAELRRQGLTVITAPYRHRWAALRALPRLLGREPLTISLFGSRRLRAAVERLAPAADLAYAFSSSMGAYLLGYDVPRVMHFPELDSDKWRQYAEHCAGIKRWVYSREVSTLLRLERRIAHEFNESVLCTPLEQRIFEQLIPGAASSVLENGVDTLFFQPRHQPRSPYDIVFTGVMNYLPNVDACVRFARQVLPRLRQHFDTRFTVVGSHPASEVLALRGLPGVEVTGFVDDTRDYLGRAAVCVAPLRIARGIQNKVLEGMAMGLPVVASTTATQGVGGVNGRDYLIADDDDQQVEAIGSLMRDPEAARALGARGRRFVEQHHSWDVFLRGLDAIVERHGRRTAPGISSPGRRSVDPPVFDAVGA